MKITYAGPTGDPVRSMDGGASAARRVVKITLKNLKRWYARLRRGTTARAGLKDERQNRADEIKVRRGRTTSTMIVDREESRDRANENLENELRESLANSGQAETRAVPPSTTTSTYIHLTINGFTGDDDLLEDLPRTEAEELEGSFNSP